jgi:hypothetical protein
MYKNGRYRAARGGMYQPSPIAKALQAAWWGWRTDYPYRQVGPFASRRAAIRAAKSWWTK